MSKESGNPTSSDYFTKDVEERMNSLSEAEMFELLKDFINQPHWFALLRYTQERLRMAQNSIISTNPYQDPHAISVSQGIMLGLSDVQNAVIYLNTKKDKEDEAGSEEE